MIQLSPAASRFTAATCREKLNKRDAARITDVTHLEITSGNGTHIMLIDLPPRAQRKKTEPHHRLSLFFSL